MTFGPLSVHARFSQPHDRVAIVVALNLFVSKVFAYAPTARGSDEPNFSSSVPSEEPSVSLNALRSSTPK